MHIARLRAKLRDPESNDDAEAIITVRSHGYMAGPGLSVPGEKASP
jgi:DNA-binding response OmpR family regulator